MSESDERDRFTDEDQSLGELVEQLGRDSTRLALHEAALSASRHAPELRQVALGAGVSAAIVLAFLTAFALANWAAVEGLSSLMPTWLAALALAAAWVVIGVVLVLVVRARLLRGRAGVWVRVLGDDRQAAVAQLEASRDEAERAVRATLDGAGGALAVAAADQMIDSVDDIGDELLDASEDIVERIAETVPGSSAIGQMVDIVLLPGRVGLRVATSVLRSNEDDTTR
jgi:hypothetical protein